jgi:carbon storage regulator CsrA
VLVLTRKPSESIIIGERVTETILEVLRNQIRLGIKAPKKMRSNGEGLLGSKVAVAAA